MSDERAQKEVTKLRLLLCPHNPPVESAEARFQYECPDCLAAALESYAAEARREEREECIGDLHMAYGHSRLGAATALQCAEQRIRARSEQETQDDDPLAPSQEDLRRIEHKLAGTGECLETPCPYCDSAQEGG